MLNSNIMRNAERGIWKKEFFIKKSYFRIPHSAFFVIFLLAASSLVWAKWEKEQVALENDLTQRIEGILSKTLSPNSYLVTVKVEMSESAGGGVNRTVNKRGGENPFMKKNRFVLSGVPEKKQFN